MALLSGPWQPAWVLGRAYARLFDKIPAGDSFTRAVPAAASRGSVVHVVRNVSVLDLLALDHLSMRLDFPRIGFANELGAWLGPPRIGKPPAEQLRETVRSGLAALLFMKRPPSVLPKASATHRG